MLPAGSLQADFLRFQATGRLMKMGEIIARNMLS
jgi:hypothetical protein